MTPNPTYLPLETLIQMLERRAFHLTPDQKVRIQKILGLMGQKGFDSPAGLRNYLCPLIAKTGAEQQRFYQIFDEWLERHVKPPEQKEIPRPEVLERERRKWVIPVAISGILVIGLLIWIIIAGLLTSASAPPEKPKPFFTLEDRCIRLDQPFLLTNQSPDTTLKFSWDFGDGKIDSANWSPLHSFNKPGTYTINLKLFRETIDSSYSRKIYVHDNERPHAKFTYLEKNGVYDFIPDSTQALWQYQWEMGEGGNSTELFPNAILSEGKHSITLSVSLPDDSMGLCTDRSTQILDLRKELVELPPLSPVHDPGRESERQWKKTWVYTWFIGWVLILLIVPFAYDRYRRRPPDTPEFRRSLIDGGGPPVELPFPSQDELVGSKGDIQALAQVLRRREAGERVFLDIHGTLRETIYHGGYPVLSFQQRTRPLEYLALVEVRGPNDQQARFFNRFLELLQS
ncbi:MAG: hypothetical protein KDD63_21695, partial [Bacteroidetes bacterium]|nr:hypothetical protein [Bacteroidota bacterium]